MSEAELPFVILFGAIIIGAGGGIAFIIEKTLEHIAWRRVPSIEDRLPESTVPNTYPWERDAAIAGWRNRITGEEIWHCFSYDDLQRELHIRGDA